MCVPSFRVDHVSSVPMNTCSLPRQQRKLGRTQRVSNAAMSLTTTGLALMSTVVRSTWRIVEEEQSKNHASIQFIILSFYRRSLSIRPILERFSVAYAAKFLATLLINCYIVEVTKSLKKKVKEDEWIYLFLLSQVGMVQVKDVSKSSPELQALIESEVKQLLKVSKKYYKG